MNSELSNISESSISKSSKHHFPTMLSPELVTVPLPELPEPAFVVVVFSFFDFEELPVFSVVTVSAEAVVVLRFFPDEAFVVRSAEESVFSVVFSVVCVDTVASVVEAVLLSLSKNSVTGIRAHDVRAPVSISADARAHSFFLIILLFKRVSADKADVPYQLSRHFCAAM